MEKPSAKGANNFVVGMFVFVSFLVVAGFVVFMGGSSPFSREASVRAFFRDIRGLNVGAPVFFSGIQVGRVKGYQFPNKEEALVPGQENGVFVVMSLFSENKNRISKDSLVTIATQGVLGDKVIVIRPGSESAGVVPSGTTMASVQPSDLGDYFKKGGDLVENLNLVVGNLNTLIGQVQASGKVPSILNNLDRAANSFANTGKALEGDDVKVIVKSLRRVIEKVDRGDGTLGALINDPSLHEDLRVLLGGAQRSKTVRFLIRQAISASDSDPKPAPKK